MNDNKHNIYNNNSNNTANYDIEDQTFTIGYDQTDYDDEKNNFKYNENINDNSPLEKFKLSNALYNLNNSTNSNNTNNTCNQNNFRKSQSYPNNYSIDYFNNSGNHFTEINLSNDIELVNVSTNPIVRVNLTENMKINALDETKDEINTLDETSSLMEESNSKINICCSKSNYLVKFYYWVGLDKISVRTELLNKFISILLHIFIMVIFEIYFYFNFVVSIEKQQFLDKIQQYINEFEHNLNLNEMQKELIRQFFKLNYSETFLENLYMLYIESLNAQKKLLHHLMVKTCGVAGIIGIVLIGLIVYGLWYKYKIKWRWIWVENLLMFLLLGIFEYWFFMNVILNYNPITDDEIKYYIANQFVNYFNSTG